MIVALSVSVSLISYHHFHLGSNLRGAFACQLLGGKGDDGVQQVSPSLSGLWAYWVLSCDRKPVGGPIYYYFFKFTPINDIKI